MKEEINALPTIEDVLKKNIKVTTIGKESNYEWPNHGTLLEAIKAAMTEWASLTPSNEKYGWVKASERCPDIPPIETDGDLIHCKYELTGRKLLLYPSEIREAKADIKWLDESTPIPLTPCGWDFVLQYQEAMDKIYNESDAAREAVIKHFGIHHKIQPEEVKKLINATTH